MTVGILGRMDFSIAFMIGYLPRKFCGIKQLFGLLHLKGPLSWSKVISFSGVQDPACTFLNQASRILQF